MSGQLNADDHDGIELRQQLRVLQIGSLVLTGFLATLPFHERFSTLQVHQQGLYLATLFLAASAALVVSGPGYLHRLVLCQASKAWLQTIGERCVRAGLVLSGWP